MEVSYKHDATHSFLVIEPDREVDTKAYPIRMVLGNTIPGLLPCRLQKADGKVLFYYEITARQQISDVYQKLTYTELKSIYLGLLKIFEQMDMYLLNADQLLLGPEYVYLDKMENALYLCYLPGYGVSAQEQMLRFTEYLLPRVEHQDSRGVMLGYGLYRLLMEEGLHVDAVGEMLRRSEQEEVQRMPTDVPEESVPEDKLYGADRGPMAGEGDRDGGGGYGDRKNRWKKDLILILAGTVLIGGSLVLRERGCFFDVPLPLLLMSLFCGILLAALAAWNGKRKEEEREKNEEDMAEGSEGHWEKGGGPPQGDETVVLYRSPGYGCPVLVCRGAGQAPPILLDKDMIVVGKMDGVSDVLLDRPAISRVHARIQKKEGGYWIADLDSKNGTFVNGKKLEKEEEHLLQEDDLVVFADIDYRYSG